MRLEVTALQDTGMNAGSDDAAGLPCASASAEVSTGKKGLPVR